MANVGKIVSKVAKAVTKKKAAPTASTGSRSVKVSSNVLVTAKRGKRISSAEEARLNAINKSVKTTAKGSKANAKALKASGKVKPKTDTKYTTYYDSFGKNTTTARNLAKEAAAKRAASKMR